jgi:hypothetical protein
MQMHAQFCTTVRRPPLIAAALVALGCAAHAAECGIGETTIIIVRWKIL